MKFVTRVGNNLINQVVKVTSFFRRTREKKTHVKKLEGKMLLLNCIENNNRYQPT